MFSMAKHFIKIPTDYPWTILLCSEEIEKIPELMPPLLPGLPYTKVTRHNAPDSEVTLTSIYRELAAFTVTFRAENRRELDLR